jgi:predicted dehydrogenase
VHYAEPYLYAPVVRQGLALVTQLGQLSHLEVRAIQQRPPGPPTAALLELGVHSVALALGAAGAAGHGSPQSLQATLTASGDVDSHAEVRLKFASGLVARVEAAWQEEAGAHWDLQAASGSGVVRAELMPDPSLEHNGEPVELPPTSGPLPQVVHFGYAALLGSLSDAMRHDRDPDLGAPVGRVVLDVICAAYWSAGRDGAPVALPFDGDRERTPVELWRGG